MKGSNLKTAFVFPGQGSQHAGMGKDFFEAFHQARLVMEEASDTLGLDMNKLILGDDEKLLNLTENTQPALLTVSMSILNVLERETGIKPLCVSGHSLGEYTANVFADSIDFSKALLITKKRGIFMQEACPVGFGKMAAVIGLGRDVIKSVIEEVNLGCENPLVFVANYNSPVQTVISGESLSIDRACEKLKEKGARRIVILPVSAPSHTPFMEGAKKNLSAFFNDSWFRDAKIDIFSNATSLNYTIKDDIIRFLLEQIVSPVRWDEIILNMEKLFGVNSFIEIGPSNVLGSLIKRIDKNASVISVNNVSSLNELEKFIS